MHPGALLSPIIDAVTPSTAESMIVCQPNGLYAQFSSAASDFVVFGLTRKDAVAVCHQSKQVRNGEALVVEADGAPPRFGQQIEIVRRMFGVGKADLRTHQMSEPRPGKSVATVRRRPVLCRR